MPKLLRSRYVNITNQSNRKIPDLTLDADGMNLVFVLANGGGKSTLIQFLANVILPNRALNTRKLEDTVAPGTSGHVVTEWLLDGEERYLCMGFSYFLSKSKELEYFNYLFDYGPRDHVRFEHLPLVKDGLCASYTNYKDWLKENVGSRYFESNSKDPRRWYNRLRNFRFSPDEWKSIAQTLEGEGRVDHYFEKANTEEKLLTQILIPQVEDALFDDTKRETDIIKGFQELQQYLERLPQRQENLREADSFYRQGKDVLTALEAAYEQVEKHEALRGNLIRLTSTITEEISEKASLAAKLAEEETRLNQVLEDLNWKIASYEPFAKKLDEQEAKLFELHQQEVCDAKRRDSVDAKFQHNTLLAYQKFEEVKKLEQEIAGLEEQISRFGEEATLQKEKLENAKQTLDASWSKEWKDTKERLLDEEQALQTDGIGLEDVKKKLADNDSALLKNQREEVEIEKWFEQFQKTAEPLGADAEDPEASLQDCERKITELLERKQRLSEEKKFIEGRYHKTLENLDEQNQQKEHEKTDWANEEEQLLRNKAEARIFELESTAKKKMLERAGAGEIEVAKGENLLSAVNQFVNQRFWTQLNEIRKTFDEKTSECQSQKAAMQAQREKCERERTALTFEIEALERWESSRLKRRQELDGWFHKTGISPNTSEEEVANRLSDAESHRVRVQSNFEEADETLNRCERGELFIAHNDLVRVQDYLFEHGITVQLGSELAETASDPLMPYALIANPSDLKNIETILTKMDPWISDVPVLFVDGAKASDNPSFVYLNQNAWLFQPAQSIWNDEEKLQALIEQYEQTVQNLQTELERAVDMESGLRSLGATLSEYNQTYPDQSVVDNKYATAEKQTRFQLLADEINRLNAMIKDCEFELENIRTEHHRSKEQSEQTRDLHLKEVSEIHLDFQTEKRNVQSSCEKSVQDISKELFAYKLLLKQELIEQKHHARDAFAKEMNECENALQSARTEESEANQRKNGILAFLPFFRALSRMKQKQQQIKDEFASLEASKMEFQEQKNTLEETRLARRTSINRLHDKQNGLNDDASKYKIEPIGALEETGLAEYKLAVSAFEREERIFQQKYADIYVLNQTIESKQQLCDAELHQIEQYGQTRIYLENHPKQVTYNDIDDAKTKSEMAEREHNEAETALKNATAEWDRKKAVLEHVQKHYAIKYANRPLYEGFGVLTHQGDIESLRVHAADTTKSIDDGKVVQDLLKDQTRNLQTEKNSLLSLVPSWSDAVPALDEKPDNLLGTSILWKKEFIDSKEQLAEKKDKARKTFDWFCRTAEEASNHRLKNLAQNLISMKEEQFFDYPALKKQFNRIFESLDRLKEHLHEEIAECEIGKSQLVRLCVRRTREVYDGVMELPGNSKIKLFNRELWMVRIRWTSWTDEEASKMIGEYLDRLLDQLHDMMKNDVPIEKRQRHISEQLSTNKLLDLLSPFSKCSIEVVKPEEKEIFEAKNIEFKPWNQVHLWSGGEKYAVYMIMFMILVHYARVRSGGKEEAWKVIPADNPFGEASSGHILTPIFEVAKRNKVQLLCFTAHHAPDIIGRFPCVYTAMVRSFLGQGNLVATRMETGFYQIFGGESQVSATDEPEVALEKGFSELASK